jgi:Spy/CpxP family protein refolding chaperone
MNRFICLLALTLTLAFTAIATAGPGKAAFTGPDRESFPRIRQILSSLNLNADQQTKVNDILDQAATQVRNLRDQAKTGDKSAAREQLKSIRKEIISKIEPVLTNDQKTTFHEKLKALREEVRSREGQNKQPTTQPQD